MTPFEVSLVVLAGLVVTVSHYAWAWAGFQLGKRRMAERYSAEMGALIVANNEHLKTVMDLQARLRVAVAQAEAAGIASPLSGNPN